MVAVPGTQQGALSSNQISSAGPVGPVANAGSLKVVSPGGVLQGTYVAGAKTSQSFVNAKTNERSFVNAKPPQVILYSYPNGLPTETQSPWWLEVDIQDRVLRAQIQNYNGETAIAFAHVPIAEVKDTKGHVTAVQWADVQLQTGGWPTDGTGNDDTVKQCVGNANQPSADLIKKYGVAFGIQQGTVRGGQLDSSSGYKNTPTYWLQHPGYSNNAQLQQITNNNI